MRVPQAFLFRLSARQERKEKSRNRIDVPASRQFCSTASCDTADWQSARHAPPRRKHTQDFGSQKRLAATYSRASYTGTTIGKTVFDGRVRDGIGSDHSFMATKKNVTRLKMR